MFGLDSDDTVNFIYLVLLLILLANGVLFNSKIKKSEVLKQLFLWLIIALVIIVIYSFRFEFIGIKNRIAGELFPGKAQSLGNNQISINISDDRHFYINLKVNGKNVRFMIDTGASDIVLNESDAKRIGIDLSKLSYNRIYQTANGKSLGAMAIVETIELNGLMFYDVGVSINNSDMGTSLLGMSFLRNFKRYEFYQDKLILTY